MKKIILFVTCLFTVLANAQSPTFQWAKAMGGTFSDDGYSIAVDASGNVYTTGPFRWTADFDPGPGTFNLTATGVPDIFVTKLNTSGNFVWAKQLGGTNFEEVFSIAVDASGNVYTSGAFQGTADFDPGPGTFNLTSFGNSDIFISKLDASGNFVWAKQLGGTSFEKGHAIVVDAPGNIYTTGYFNGTTDFDPGSGTFNLTAAGSSEIFISKLDASGNFVWAKQMGGTNYDQAHGIAIDNSGNIYTSGTFQGTADFDPGAGIFNLTAAGYVDIFVSKLNASGNFVWAKSMGGTNDDRSFSITTDVSGNVYTTGQFYGSADFNPGPGTFSLVSAGGFDIFISKLDALGNFIWAKNMGGDSTDIGNSIKVDASGNVYTTGIFWNTADFNPGSGTFNLTSFGNADIFISKLDASGNFLWTKNIGEIYYDYGNSIAVDASANVYVTGSFGGTADFDPGAGTFNLTPAGASDIYVLKMSQCIPPAATISPSGPTTFCSPGSVTLNANTGTGLTYQWKKDGVSISGATSSSYVATTTGSYTCFLSNSCGAVTSNSIQVTVSTTIPATPGAITTTGGAVKVCPGDTRTYSFNAVSGATSYTWTPCAGSTITSGQNTNSVTVQYNAGFLASDTIRVVANNSCGTSAQRKLKISRNTPGTPAAITGNNFGVCNLNGIPFSVTNVSGITYNWSFNTGTATVASGQGTSSITTNYGAGFVSGSLSVTASNGCGTSAARLKTIYAKPATPVSITGATSVCVNQQNVPYSIAPLANVTNYTWTGPTGSHISDGITTSSGTTLITTHSSVTVDFATTAGSVKVRGNNACASGSYKTLSVAIVCREGDFSPDISETRLFPNPASSEFTLETDEVSIPFDVDVFDAYGRLIFSETNLSSGHLVNTNDWADGLYSVVVRNGNNITTLKLVIQGF